MVFLQIAFTSRFCLHETLLAQHSDPQVACGTMGFATSPGQFQVSLLRPRRFLFCVCGSSRKADLDVSFGRALHVRQLLYPIWGIAGRAPWRRANNVPRIKRYVSILSVVIKLILNIDWRCDHRQQVSMRLQCGRRRRSAEFLMTDAWMDIRAGCCYMYTDTR